MNGWIFKNYNSQHPVYPFLTGEEAEQRCKECNKTCCEFGSLMCFEKQGQIYDRATRSWMWDENGNHLFTRVVTCPRNHPVTMDYQQLSVMDFIT